MPILEPSQLVVGELYTVLSKVPPIQTYTQNFSHVTPDGSAAFHTEDGKIVEYMKDTHYFFKDGDKNIRTQKAILNMQHASNENLPSYAKVAEEQFGENLEQKLNRMNGLGGSSRRRKNRKSRMSRKNRKSRTTRKNRKSRKSRSNTRRR